MVWYYPDSSSRKPLAIQTHHSANLFGVRFLPCTGDSMLVSGAMDHTVQLHVLDASPHAVPPASRSSSSRAAMPDTTAGTAAAGRQQRAGLQVVTPRTSTYHCHRSRVKVRQGPGRGMMGRGAWQGGRGAGRWLMGHGARQGDDGA